MEVITLKDKPKITLGEFIEIIKVFGFNKICGGTENGKIILKLKKVKKWKD